MSKNSRPRRTIAKKSKRKKKPWWGPTQIFGRKGK